MHGGGGRGLVYVEGEVVNVPVTKPLEAARSAAPSTPHGGVGGVWVRGCSATD
jgi:hypothetical protein